MKSFILFSLFALTFIGCTKYIAPKLQTASPQLVIEGAVSDTVGPYYVYLKTTVGFYDQTGNPPVTGARVTITDVTMGITDQLKETSAGTYQTGTILQGVPGHTYRMVAIIDTNRYAATSTMPTPVTLDSVSFDVSDTKSIRPQANYQDPVGLGNHYKYNFFVNGVFDKRFATFDDRLSDGRYIMDKMDVDTNEVRRGDLITFCLVSIDKQVYTYFNESEDVAYNNSSLAAPLTSASNISGGCLGYFSAQSISIRSNTVKY